MTSRLSPEEFALLEDLNKRGGKATISDAKPRHVADGLVAAGYATAHSLNVSVVEYQITLVGRTILILNAFGLGRLDPLALTIEPHQLDVDGIWYVKVNSPGNPTELMSVSSAMKLVEQLRAARIDELAKRFEAEIKRTRRYAGAE